MSKFKAPQLWHPAPYEDADVAAVKALFAGNANEGQQKRVVKWLLFDVCRIRDELFVPGQGDVRDYLLGRRSVGLQVARLSELKPGKVDPRGPPPAMPPQTRGE